MSGSLVGSSNSPGSGLRSHSSSLNGSSVSAPSHSVSSGVQQSASAAKNGPNVGSSRPPSSSAYLQTVNPSHMGTTGLFRPYPENWDCISCLIFRHFYLAQSLYNMVVMSLKILLHPGLRAYLASIKPKELAILVTWGCVLCFQFLINCSALCDSTGKCLIHLCLNRPKIHGYYPQVEVRPWLTIATTEIRIRCHKVLKHLVPSILCSTPHPGLRSIC